MDPDTAVAAVRRHMTGQARLREARAAAHRACLLAKVPELAAILRDRYGARRVLLFGSLAWGEPDELADLDLAVEGLAAADYFEALGELLWISPAPVDLVRLEDAAPGLAARIAAEGRVIHG